MRDYIESKIWYVLSSALLIFILFILLITLNININFILLIIFILSISVLLILLFNYIIESNKQKKIINIVDNLDEKYLISELIDKPKNLTNYGYYYALKKACKAMNDKITSIENKSIDYEEYIESIIHDIKTPISALSLLQENNNDKEAIEELKKIENLIEQVLYYSRSSNPEKDYFIKEINLDDIIHPILLNFRTSLLDNKIRINIHNTNNIIYTDPKWLTFIISQIIQNSIKYKSKDSYIEICFKDDTIYIKDNGIGITKEDLSRVFDKGFTGSNRFKSKSTGIGLYLCKKLCDKLNIEISIDSKINEYTIVKLKLK